MPVIYNFFDFEVTVLMRKLVICTGCTVFLALLCRYSADCADAVGAAVTLCLTSAIPSLFPFFAASSLAISCGLAQDLGKLAAPVMRHWFHLPGCGAAALTLGFLGGYPAGARMSAELYQTGLCTKEQASALAACCNNTGPAFLIGMCGGGLFHSLRMGLFLYGIHITSALLTARLIRPKHMPSDSLPTSPPENIPFFRSLIQSIVSAGQSCLMISAFILFFSVVICLLRLTGILSALCTLFFPVLSLCGLSSSGVQSLLMGSVELTQGLAGLTETAGTDAARLVTCSFLCAFGGLSVLFQTAAAADGLDIPRCVRGKCIHACFAAGLCALGCLLLSIFL